MRLYRLFSLSRQAQHIELHSKPQASMVLNVPKANVYRFGDGNNAPPVFRDLEWRINEGESWAIVGSAGNEKFTLLEMLLGYTRISPSPPRGIYPFLLERSPPRDAYDAVAIVSFTAQRRVSGGAFYDYTARYGAIRDEDKRTLREALLSNVTSRANVDEFALLAERLDLQRLLDLPMVVLSNGQTRRARIARALLGRPELLLLDEPLTGLDVQHRPKLTRLLGEIHESRSPRILMALRPQDPLPDWITHVARVEGAHVRTHVRYELPPPLPTTKDRGTPKRARIPGKELVSLKDVNVRYHERHVLKDINWTIREGDRWHLRGANGSGKTTLLSLLTGDHPQSYTQEHLMLFSLPRRRHPTVSLQRLIGTFSPELFAAFPRRLGAGALTVRDAIATGFESTFSYRPRTAEMDTRIDELLDSLGPRRWANRSNSNEPGGGNAKELPFDRRAFATLSPGEQGMVLLMRALAGKPLLLILDEVFAGMDNSMIAVATTYLQDQLEPSQAVIFVTHWEEELPWDSSCTLKITIEDGHAVIEK